MNNHATGNLNSLQLAQVQDNVDPNNRGRIKIRLLANPMELWASVVAPSAGNGYGVSFIPKLDEIVVVAFVTPELPLVIGSVWSGSSSRPQDADPQQQHYVIRTPEDSVLDFDDSGPSVKLTTRSGYHITINDAQSEVTIECGSQSIKLGPNSIDIRTSGSVNVDASSVTVNSATVTVNASMSRFSGVVQADTVIATSVVGTSYTPGAGNIW